jgi:hypothetical protein
MVEHTRSHTQIQERSVSGRRVELQSLKGARLFVGSRVNASKRVTLLLIHFQGAPIRRTDIAECHLSARSARQHKAWGVSPRIATEIMSPAREVGGSGITSGAYVFCESTSCARSAAPIDF